MYTRRDNVVIRNTSRAFISCIEGGRRACYSHFRRRRKGDAAPLSFFELGGPRGMKVFEDTDDVFDQLFNKTNAIGTRRTMAPVAGGRSSTSFFPLAIARAGLQTLAKMLAPVLAKGARKAASAAKFSAKMAARGVKNGAIGAKK
ncbi:unnamed protein product, partial [Amoebophrya sp. A25]|eukprot:GSA25T00007369001.1